jgi:hypothetical protein
VGKKISVRILELQKMIVDHLNHAGPAILPYLPDIQIPLK